MKLLLTLFILCGIISTSLEAASCRSAKIVREFKKETPIPEKYKGQRIIVDHICALIAAD